MELFGKNKPILSARKDNQNIFRNLTEEFDTCNLHYNQNFKLARKSSVKIKKYRVEIIEEEEYDLTDEYNLLVQILEETKEARGRFRARWNYIDVTTNKGLKLLFQGNWKQFSHFAIIDLKEKNGKFKVISDSAKGTGLTCSVSKLDCNIFLTQCDKFSNNMIAFFKNQEDYTSLKLSLPFEVKIKKLVKIELI